MKKPVSIKKNAVALAVAQVLLIDTSVAATIIVTNGADTTAACSFREAAETINEGIDLSNGCDIKQDVSVLGVDDTIYFAVDTVSITQGQVLINSDVSINPQGDQVSILGDESSRLIEIEDATVSIENVILSGGSGYENSPPQGGAIYINSSTVTLSNCEVTGNSASRAGGILTILSTTTLTDCNVSNNTANGDGGGIWFNSGSLEISRSIVSENTGSFGGGILVWSGSAVFSNSTISDNSASINGGGISQASGYVSLYNTTITNNTSGAGTAGGIFNSSGTTSVSNSIIAGNIGAELVLLPTGYWMDFGNNLFGHSEFPLNSFIGVTLNSNNIIASADGNRPTPLASIIGPLADNGGPTLTHGLPQGSPAIDAGNYNICSTVFVDLFDQRGEQRPQGAACDIGAFEGELEPDTSFFVVPLPNNKSVIFSL